MATRRNRSRFPERDEFDPPPVFDLRSTMEQFSIAMTRTAQSIVEELSSTCRACSGSGSPSGELDDRDVYGGEDPFENATIETVRDLIDIGNQRWRTPWGDNAATNRAYYTVDRGHKYVVKPAAEDPAAPDGVRRVQTWLNNWAKEVGWAARQNEVSLRLDRHGEVFDLLYYSEDGMLRLGFAEPQDLEEDPNSEYQSAEDGRQFYDNLGVRRTNDLLYRQVAYFVDGTGDQTGVWLGDLQYNRAPGAFNLAAWEKFSPGLRTVVQCRRRNVLSSDPRGLTLYWPVRDELAWSKLLLSNLMRVSSFQAAFGAIRVVNSAHGADAVRSYANSSQGGTVGESPDKMNFPSPAVVTTPSTVKYEFPDTGAGNSNHIEVLTELLRACSAGMKLPEFMLTANVSQGNFASTLVSEGPFHKSIQKMQDDMLQEDLRIIEQALLYAARSGRFDLTEDDVRGVNIHAKLPTVQTRNRKEDWDITFEAWKSGRISGKTLNASQNWDYEEEQAQIRAEQAAEPGPPLSEHPQVPQAPGPEPARNSGGIRERGVMNGDPGQSQGAARNI